MTEKGEAGDDILWHDTIPARFNEKNNQITANVNIEDPFIPTIII